MVIIRIHDHVDFKPIILNVPRSGGISYLFVFLPKVILDHCKDLTANSEWRQLQNFADKYPLCFYVSEREWQEDN